MSNLLGIIERTIWKKEGKTKSLAQIAADDIIKLIKDNNMEPGQRLENEYDLAKTFERWTRNDS